MKYCIFLSVVVLSLLEVYSQPSASETGTKKGAEWKQRVPRQGRLDPKDIEAQLENNMKKASHKHVLPYHIPQESQCVGDKILPSYAKALCTSYPGRVVCQLGRYTFVINNGDHTMEPEVIERFAAMVYHRTQEGDSNFDVAVDMPDVEECYCPQTYSESTTQQVKEAPKAPVFVECTPLKDERKLCNPSFTPSEVIYTCKRKEIGIGKRMVISVDEAGTVSDGRLVLPFRSSYEKRLKREKTDGWKPPLAKNRPEVKSFTDICTSIENKWCQSGQRRPGEKCTEEGCVTTIKCFNGPPDGVASIKSDNIAGATDNSFGDGVSRKGININSNDKNSLIQNSPDQQVVKLRDEDNNAEYWNAKIPEPIVRSFTDVCGLHTQLPFCLDTAARTECSTEGCVTLPECLQPTTMRSPSGVHRRRRHETSTVSDNQEWKSPLLKYKQKLLNTHTLGVKRPIMKRRRQASSCPTVCSSSSTTCPTPTTSCGPVPDPPQEVPSCVQVPSKPPCCPPAPETTKCPSQPKRQRRAPRNRWRRRKKANYQPKKMDFSENSN